MKTPVALIIFNRADTTEKVLEAIRQAKPSKLFVIADGPRANKPGEAEKCATTRAVIERVDWDCEVLKNYSDVNLGCAKRVSSGLDWVFNTVEEAIILEDDCLPHPTFFRYCEELLDRYREDERIMAICGKNVQFGHKRTEYSYYFSRYNHCWGWASWRRAWQHYDIEMKLWPEMRQQGFLKDLLIDPRAVEFWTKHFQATYKGGINTWDYQWTLTCWLQNGLSILPNVNLISNIGFSAEATHTKTTSDQNPYANMATKALEFPLKHPPFIIADRQADDFSQNTLFNPTFSVRVQAKINRILNKFRLSKDWFFSKFFKVARRTI